MLKDLIEDLILIALVGLALYLVWQKWLSGYFGAAAAAVDSQIQLQKESIATIAAATPSSVLSDLWTYVSNPYISQAQFKTNIADIKAGLLKD